MTLNDLMGRIAHWAVALPTYKKVLIGFAVTVFLIELAFRRFAPKSNAYEKWTHVFEAIGSVWTAVILSLVYLISVGPISLLMKLAGKDPLDRALAGTSSAWKTHEPNPLGPVAAARHQF